MPEQPPPRGTTPATPTPAAPTQAALPQMSYSMGTEGELRRLMDQTLAAAAVHGTDRVKSMLAALTPTDSPSPLQYGSMPIGPQQGSAGSTNSSAGSAHPPSRDQTAVGQHGHPQEGQNCEYPDLNLGQANAQVPPTQPGYPPLTKGSEVWLGPQGAPNDIFAAMKAIFDTWHGQGNSNTRPPQNPVTQETGQSGRHMGETLPVPQTPATATAVGTTVCQVGTNGHHAAMNINNASQYTCTVGSLTAHVSEAIKEKIWRSEYVDIFELLRKECGLGGISTLDSDTFRKELALLE
ncbi:uncharacterized protein LOC115083272 [Rhinatrema bivittatum]|uniref:uncharacterized protein LOC115083272 n=1 Tax=Rhinatrema bivittatum TaxID=194408 RepID=UPI001128EE93|nr:uncharacterized protein LOC115083272 [Rhinatrema bivittatum]